MKRTAQFLLLVALITGSASIVAEPSLFPDPAQVKQGVLIVEDVFASIDMNGKEDELRALISSKYSAEDAAEIFATIDAGAKAGAEGLLFLVQIAAPDNNNLNEQKAKVAYLMRVAALSSINRLGKEAFNDQIDFGTFVLNNSGGTNRPSL